MRPLFIAIAQVRPSRFAHLKAARHHLQSRPTSPRKPCTAGSKEPRPSSCFGRGTHALRPRYTCTPAEVHMHSGRGTHVLRPRHACTPDEIRMCFGRSTSQNQGFETSGLRLPKGRSRTIRQQKHHTKTRKKAECSRFAVYTIILYLWHLNIKHLSHEHQI